MCEFPAHSLSLSLPLSLSLCFCLSLSLSLSVSLCLFLPLSLSLCLFLPPPSLSLFLSLKTQKTKTDTAHTYYIQCLKKLILFTWTKPDTHHVVIHESGRSSLLGLGIGLLLLHSDAQRIAQTSSNQVLHLICLCSWEQPCAPQLRKVAQNGVDAVCTKTTSYVWSNACSW